jgi:DNA-binding NtrC family response regulator
MSSTKILIVEDDRCAIEELADFLRWHLGAEVTVADSVAAARRQVVDGGPPDVCLLDIRMPHECGLELVPLLFEGEAAAAPLVIVMSGFHDEPTLDRIKRLSLPFLPKPIELVRLLELLQSRSVPAETYADRV